MISGIFHEGSGLGDQLFRYITTRTLAEDKGFQWGMIGKFKGIFFPEELKFVNAPPEWILKGYVIKNWNEKKTLENAVDIRSYDPEINFVEDDTVIDGSFEDDKYWRHKLPQIDKWLKVKSLVVPDNLCIVGFRGGEYMFNSELFLGKDYWDSAIAEMRKINPDMQFQVHTDDPALAKQFFPEFEVIENTKIAHSQHSNMGFNWRSARYAKYAIIPNSAFFIIPRLLRHQDSEAITIAPRYWARRSSKVWARPACHYREFRYL